MKISEDQKFIFGAVGLFIVLCLICLAIGGIFNACDNRKIRKQEANINAAQTNVKQGEKKVNEAKEDSSEVKGEIKVLKEELREQNEEVNRTIKNRREAGANSDRIRRQSVSNVNGADLNRILNEADNR